MNFTSHHLPKITVVTPSLNQGKYLERTIRSVLDQNYPNLEYYVLDGGSTDETLDILQDYEEHLAGWISQRDDGQASAINRGFTMADGDILAYLNSDDVYLPSTLSRVGALMSGRNSPRWLVGACLRIDAQDRVIDRFDHHLPATFPDYLMHTSGMIPQPSCFWSAQLVRQRGLFDASLHYCFDYEYHCRLLGAGERPLLIDSPLAAFRDHSESKGGSAPLNFGLERMKVARRYAGCLDLPDWWRLQRNLGYRQRCYAIQQAKADPSQPLWARVLRRPWWLASSDIRGELRPHPRTGKWGQEVHQQDARKAA